VSLLIVFLLTVAATTYVVLPLFRRAGPGPEALMPVTAEAFVADGVAYRSEDEWAVDRALDKTGDGEPGIRAHQARLDVDGEIEQQVAAILTERREARAGSKRVLCPNCGKPFQAGDRFCARCGESHPNTCLRCGERHRLGDRFCTRCGTALPGGEV
jgi:hypothetical protein